MGEWKAGSQTDLPSSGMILQAQSRTKNGGKPVGLSPCRPTYFHAHASYKAQLASNDRPVRVYVSLAPVKFASLSRSIRLSLRVESKKKANRRRRRRRTHAVDGRAAVC